mmetsp:Transcript_11303/g.26430  ORF Transcript_11303/g.26430 Transcript_11303/m.26430 type:complete len:280 (+) Transcript_11303:92-931(+)
MMMKPSLALAPLFLFLEPPPAGRGACAFVTRSVSLTRKAAVKVSYSNSDDNADGESKPLAATPSFIETPLLLLLYPSLVSHKKEFGNPNIPLGSPDGKRCATVRRLHFQGKLSAEEVDHLQEMGFRFNSFEDVYYENDFEEMFGTLMHYYSKTKTFQIPKKYEPDPELGAWVTMLRRLYNSNELPQNELARLDEVGFEWVSTRKCGSSFMKGYRDALAYLSKVAEQGGEVRELLREEHDIKKWVDAQRLAWEKGNLSESRIQYMDDLPGIDWRNPMNWA